MSSAMIPTHVGAEEEKSKFAACQKEVIDRDYMDVEKCEKATADGLMEQMRKTQGQALLDFMKTRTLNNMKHQHKAFVALRDCASGKIKSHNNLSCEDILHKVKVESLMVGLPEIRTELALIDTALPAGGSSPLVPLDSEKVREEAGSEKGLSHYSERAMMQRFNPQLEHELTDVKIPPLTTAEMLDVLDVYENEEELLRQEHRKGLHPVDCDKMVMTSPALCRANINKAERDAIATGIRAFRKSHRANYLRLIHDNPLLAHIDAREVTDPDIDKKIGEAASRYLKILEREYKKLQKKKGDDLLYLVANNELVESTIKSLPPEHRSTTCNVAEGLSKDLFWDELGMDLLLGAGIALGGVAVCAATATLGCVGGVAVAVGVASAAVGEAAIIAKEQAKYEQTVANVLMGTGSAEDAEAQRMTRNLSVAMSPLAMWGTGVGSHIVTRTLRTRFTNETFDRMWTRGLSKAQREALPTKLVGDSALRETHGQLKDTLIQLSRDKSKVLPARAQDDLMKNVNRAIADLGTGESLPPMDVALAALKEMAASPVTSRAYKEALGRLNTYTKALKEINLEKDTRFRARVVKWVHKLVGRGKITQQSAEKLQRCLHEPGGGATSRGKSPISVASCWF
ncbi:MAG: hypothetical protein H6624_06435 [Bdellovibrionaceae bacterium]|nr:hypothetical protein [Bdellovibrionales bacterium]MCB9083961.1 hypothetical protein [Pseudobdellovibrionaceae bacterium]